MKVLVFGLWVFTVFTDSEEEEDKTLSAGLGLTLSPNNLCCCCLVMAEFLVYILPPAVFFGGGGGGASKWS